MPLCRPFKLRRAELVLSMIELRLHNHPDQFTVEHYQNGRELGFAIKHYRDGRLSVAFAENRNSDQIVVYAGPMHRFDMAGNVPDEDTYRASKYFATESEAAEYAIARLIG